MHYNVHPARLLSAFALAAAAVSTAQAACLSFIEAPHLPPRNNEAAVQFYGPPPSTPAYSSDCSAISWSGTVQGPGSTTLDPAGWVYEGAAQASPAAAHVRARSSLLGTGNPGPNSQVGAQAKSVLTFTLAPLAGASPNQLFSLQFDVVADGVFGGSSTAGHLGSASVNLEAVSSAPSVLIKEHYSDSNGDTRNKAAGSTSGPATSVTMTIDYLGAFGAGSNFFGLNLDTLVGGEAFSDFSHTAKIAGITLLSDNVELLLPEGLFVHDAPRHWSLLADGDGGGGGTDPGTDPGTVPEPGSAALALAALLIGGWRRRRCS
jgi:hypothetical protein